MTLPDYTLRLLEERYSEEAMKAWRQSLPLKSIAAVRFGEDFVVSMGKFAKSAEALSRALAALLSPRSVYAPSSPLTLALLKELYGGSE